MKTYAADFIERVNLAYHEEEASLYDGRHPEIMKDELERWARIAEKVAALKAARGKLTVLDLGTGTGFVPERLVPVLNTRDECVMTDLSPAMMARARERLKGSPMRLREMIGAAERLELSHACADVVTMNSVVHHFPSPEAVFACADRWLKPGGLLVIAHEPNALHYRNPFVLAIDRLFRWQRRVRDRWNGVASSSGDVFVDSVNRRLIKEGVISEPLAAEEVESITDIHSPTAGRTIRGERGFDPRRIVETAFPRYVVERFESYRFFGKADPGKIAVLRLLVRAVERTWPDAGALFLLVLRKPQA